MVNTNTIGNVYGLVLSDGGLHIPKNCKNARFQLSQLAAHKDFTDRVMEIITPITTINRYEYDPSKDARYGNKLQHRLTSAVHPFFTTMYERTYINGRKVIDPHYIKLLTWESMAFIYMADGNIEKSRSARLHLYFSYAELYSLAKVINDNLGVRFNVNRHKIYWYLTLKSADYDKFMQGVAPYIVPSFQYKLPRNEYLT